MDATALDAQAASPQTIAPPGAEPEASSSTPRAESSPGVEGGSGATRRRRRSRRRHRAPARRRPTAVAPADPETRAQLAAEALAEREPEAPPADNGAEAPPAAEQLEADEPEAAPAIDAGAIVEATTPILRVATKMLAWRIRQRFPGGAAGLYQGAGDLGTRLAQTLGLRVGARLSPLALGVLAGLAEVAEPFVDDLWAQPAGVQ